MSNHSNQVYQIKVTLDNTHPPIWRRILVTGNTTLLKLHDILQIVMGWEDYHLHMFTINRLIYGNPADDESGLLGTFDEARFKLSKVIDHEGQRFSYEYDFGDSWEHTLLVEKILPPQEGAYYPDCLKGKRACPPEDVGGWMGYAFFLEAIRDPDHESHQDYLDWIGGQFDPEAFDLAEVNSRLRTMGRGRSTEAAGPWVMDSDEFIRGYDLESPWPQTLSGEYQAIAEGLPLRRDIVVLLTYIRDNKVLGTQSTGNLPLKAVREICARFVNPPKLDDTIGEQIYPVRSETEVWPLHFRHILAAVGGLVTGGVGRRWKLTQLGESFLAEPAPRQIWVLLKTWWMRVNWLVAFPFAFAGDYLPPEFTMLMLNHLLELPLGVPVRFEQFVDRIIVDSRMVWESPDKDNTRFLQHSLILRTVYNPMEDFGILQGEYGPHKTLGTRYPQLSSFQITSFGKGLLEAIQAALKGEHS